MSQRSQCGREVIWFISGSLVGAGIALLCAPQSGKKTRQDIQKLGRRAVKRADQFTGEIQDSLRNLLDEVGEASQSALSAGRDISAKAKSEIMDILDSGRHFLEEEKKRWEKALRG